MKEFFENIWQILNIRNQMKNQRRKLISKKRFLVLEELEPRNAPATYTFVPNPHLGAQQNNWTSTGLFMGVLESNWQIDGRYSNTYPQNINDTAIINSVAARSFLHLDVPLTISGLTLSGNPSNELTLNGNLTVKGNLNWQGGTIDGSWLLGTELLLEGNGTISGRQPKFLEDIHFKNKGNLTWNGGDIVIGFLSDLVTDSSAFDRDPEAFFNVNPGADLIRGDSQSSYGLLKFTTNRTHFVLNSSAWVNVSFDSDAATIDIKNSRNFIGFSKDTTNGSSIFNIENKTSSLYFSGPTNTFNGTSIQGKGQVYFSSNSDTILLAAGLSVYNGEDFSKILEGPGNLIIKGNYIGGWEKVFDNRPGTFGSLGRITIERKGVLNIDFDVPQFKRNLDNYGTLKLNNSVLDVLLRRSDGRAAKITNFAPGFILIRGRGGFGGYLGDLENRSGGVVIYSSMVSPFGREYRYGFIAISFTNRGKFIIRSGNLLISPGFTQADGSAITFLDSGLGSANLLLGRDFSTRNGTFNVTVKQLLFPVSAISGTLWSSWTTATNALPS